MLALLTFAACTLQTPDEPVERPRILSVTVTPALATVEAGDSIAFQAEVIGDGVVPTAVTWSVGMPGYSSRLGRIAPDGTYTAPDVVEQTTTEEVFATCAGTQFNAGHAGVCSAVAVVEIPGPSVAVTPASLDVGPGESVQFQAEVHGSASKELAWTCSSGTIGGDGLYLAPDAALSPTAVIRAESPVTGASGEATVRLRLRPPVLSGTSGPARAGDVLTIFGSGFDTNYSHEVVFHAGAAELTAPGTFSTGSPGQITVVVPSGAASGSLSVRLGRTGFETVESNAIAFERIPQLRVHATRPVLAAGESTRIQVAFLGAPPSPLTFETDLGSMAGDVYTAPSTVAARSHANVRACARGKPVCAGVTIGIVPFRVEPVPAIVPAGGSIALQARAGDASIPATFSMASGGGAVTPGGAYAAPDAVEYAGSTWLLVDAGSGAAPVQMGVSGLAPGIVSRIADDVDPNPSTIRNSTSWGATAVQILVRGGRAYVHARPATAESHRWIDVYDLADPIRPQWMGAVESTVETADTLALARGRLYVLGGNGSSSAVEVFDLSGPMPVLVAQSIGAAKAWLVPPTTDGDFVYEFSVPSFPSGNVITVGIRSLAEGPLPPARTVTAYVPSGNSCFRESATAAAGRVYLPCQFYRDGLATCALNVWDVSGNAALLVGVPVSHPAGLSNVQPRVFGQLLEACGTSWDRASPLPTEVPPIEGITVASSGSAYVSRTGQGDVVGVDRAVLSEPRVRSTVHGSTVSFGPGALNEGRYYAVEADGTIAIYDLAPHGGPVRVGASSPRASMDTLGGAAAEAGFLYAGGGYAGAGALGAWDLGTAPPSLAWSAASAKPIRALAAGGGLLLAGSSVGLDVYSIEVAGTPTALATYPVDASAVARVGSLAWIGTPAGELIALDLAAPSAPAEIGRVSLGGGIEAIAMLPAGGVAVATAGATGGDLVLVDGSAPAAPSLLGAAGLATPVYDVATDGATAFATTAGELISLDVATPAAPTVLGRVPLAEATPYAGAARPPHVQVNGGLVWAVPSAGNDIVRAYDMRAPAWPRLVVESGVGSSGLVLDGARAYAPYILYGLAWLELDVSAPRNVLLTSGPAPLDPPGVTLPVTLP